MISEIEYEERVNVDYEFGISQEDKLLKTLRRHIDPLLFKSANKFYPFDYQSPKSYVELKSRRNCISSDYPTFMIGKNKVEKAFNTKRDVWFCWYYPDGLFVYKFDENDFVNGDIYYSNGGRWDRGRDERKQVAYVRTHLASKVEIIEPQEQKINCA